MPLKFSCRSVEELEVLEELQEKGRGLPQALIQVLPEFWEGEE